MCKRLTKEFYLRDTLTVAKELVGKILVRETPNGRISLKITETEAYIGAIDKACHAYGGKVTPRTKTLYKEGGISYVYLIYGMYHCFNIITEKEGTACGVLIRGGAPFENKNMLSLIRYNKPYNALTKYQLKNFANGPGKLCLAMGIDMSFNEKSLLENDFYVEDRNFNEKILTGKRINIDYAEEAVNFLWRFYIS